MKTYFNDMSFTDIVITVLGVFVAISFLSFLLGVVLCLGGIALKMAFLVICVTVIYYGVNYFKNKFIK